LVPIHPDRSPELPAIRFVAANGAASAGAVLRLNFINLLPVGSTHHTTTSDLAAMAKILRKKIQRKGLAPDLNLLAEYIRPSCELSHADPHRDAAVSRQIDVLIAVISRTL
jgi:hypothetical protein